MKTIFSLFCFAFFIAACTKEKIIEKEIVVNPPEKSWQKHEAFQFGNEEVFNSSISEDNLFLYGHETFSNINKEGIVSHALNILIAPSRYRLPLNSEIYLATSSVDGLVVFRQNLWPVVDGVVSSFNIKDLDSNYHGFDFNRLNTGDAALISKNNKILIPYRTTNTETTFTQLGLLLVQTSVSNESFNVVDTLFTKRFVFQRQFTVGLQTLNLVNNIFFISTNDGVYRIGEDNELTKVSSNFFSKIFEYNSRFYAISFNEVFVSDDLGLTWQSEFNLSTNLDIFLFEVIDEKLYAFYNSQIFNIEISENDFFVQELLNDGLEGSVITSLVKFNEKIYVTSLSGVFSKPYSQFNTLIGQ